MRHLKSFTFLLIAILGCCAVADTQAFDLFKKTFKKDIVKATVWELNEQYVRLVQIEAGAKPNAHPVALDHKELADALASLQLWVDGGVFRDEEAISVYPRSQASLIADYLADALSKASADEDVTFNVRGYTDVMLGIAREREWTTGRAFYVDGELNLIIGEHRKRLDKAKKNIEGSFGVIDDFRDVYFQVGSRNHKGKMEGRIVTTEGVEPGDPSGKRPDWAIIDVNKAALSFRELQIPETVRREEKRAKAEAAKLTLERRQMREEMARMRKELQELQTGSGAAGAKSIEERLARLQELRDKGLISNEDFELRKGQILSEI